MAGLSVDGENYTLPPEAAERFHAEARAQARPLMLGLFGVGVLAGAAVGLIGWFPWWVIALVLPPYAGFLIAAAAVHLRTQRDKWATYQLVLSPHSLTRQEAGRKPVTIHREQITQLLEVEQAGLVVKGLRHRVIFVPKEMTGYDDLKARLQTWLS